MEQAYPRYMRLLEYNIKLIIGRVIYPAVGIDVFTLEIYYRLMVTLPLF